MFLLSVAISLSCVWIAAWTDLHTRTIPNKLTLPLAGIALLLAFFQGGEVLRSSLLGFGISGGLFFLLWFPGAVGGGDAKLMAGIGALLGYPLIWIVIVLTSLYGALLALLILGFGRIPFVDRWKDPDGDSTPRRKKSLPYGLAIALGVTTTLFLGFVM